MNRRSQWLVGILTGAGAISIFFLFVNLTGANAEDAAWCAPGVPRYTPHAITGATCPNLGRMGDIKLAIPGHYLLGPISYPGLSIWKPEDWKKRPKVSTLETELSHFAIKIRQANFKPIETYQDLNDYGKLGYFSIDPQPPENRWLEIGFEFIGKPRETNRKNQLNRWLAKDNLMDGPYVHQSRKVWGLDHYVSVHQPTTRSDQIEIFYDTKTNKTFIICRSRLSSVPPHELQTHCQHEFDYTSPESGEVVLIDTNIAVKSDLAHWREFEAGIRAVFASFIVH